MHSYSTKDIQHYKESSNLAGSWTIFSSRISSIFHRLHIEQQIPRPVDNRSVWGILFWQKEKKNTVKNQFMVNNRGYIIHKVNHHKKGQRHDYDIYKNNHPVTPKQVVNVLDLGYLGVEKDFPE
jgi:hypothetical protein